MNPGRTPGTLDINVTDVAVEFNTANDERTRCLVVLLVLCNEIHKAMQ